MIPRDKNYTVELWPDITGGLPHVSFLTSLPKPENSDGFMRFCYVCLKHTWLTWQGNCSECGTRNA